MPGLAIWLTAQRNYSVLFMELLEESVMKEQYGWEIKDLNNLVERFNFTDVSIRWLVSRYAKVDTEINSFKWMLFRALWRRITFKRNMYINFHVQAIYYPRFKTHLHYFVTVSHEIIICVSCEDSLRRLKLFLIY